MELTSTISWTSIEANEAEQNIRDFIDNFPFIRNKTHVMVDKDNRTVTADFKGALPGMRVGFLLALLFKIFIELTMMNGKRVVKLTLVVLLGFCCVTHLYIR